MCHKHLSHCPQLFVNESISLSQISPVLGNIPHTRAFVLRFLHVLFVYNAIGLCFGPLSAAVPLSVCCLICAPVLSLAFNLFSTLLFFGLDPKSCDSFVKY